MAMTAVLSVDRSSVAAGTPVAVRCVVSNSGGSDVNVTELVPTVAPLGSPGVASTIVPFLPAVVPAGGSLGFGWSFLAHAAAKPDATQGSYSCGAAIVCSDGTLLSPTAPTVQVASPFDAPAQLDAGHLRFDSNLNDGLAAVL
jgi:hypothetical protein